MKNTDTTETTASGFTLTRHSDGTASVTLPPDLQAFVAAMAQREGITLDEACNKAIERGLELLESGDQPTITLPLSRALQDRAEAAAKWYDIPLSCIYRAAISSTIEGLEKGKLTIQGPG
jgi:hypothetical protein